MTTVFYLIIIFVTVVERSFRCYELELGRIFWFQTGFRPGDSYINQWLSINLEGLSAFDIAYRL